ncbi:MAG: hypothetical protein AAF329_05760 [Cyanobacteria bacterium P01_A01_bin.17]
MKRLPEKVINQANRIKASLSSGVHWSQLGGRKLHNHVLVVFELRQYYRLLCWFEESTLNRSKVLSHEAYNSYAANTRR